MHVSLGEHNWNFVSGFSWTLPYVAFSFADFNLYLFAVIHCNHEQNSFPGSLSPFTKSLNLTVIVGTSDTPVNPVKFLLKKKISSFPKRQKWFYTLAGMPSNIWIPFPPTERINKGGGSWPNVEIYLCSMKQVLPPSYQLPSFLQSGAMLSPESPEMESLMLLLSCYY